jgi:hypothetical protein
MSMSCRFFLLTALLTVGSAHGSAHGGVIDFNLYTPVPDGISTVLPFPIVDGFTFSADASGAQITSGSTLSGANGGLTNFLLTDGSQVITMARATPFNLTSVTAGLNAAGLLKTLTVGAQVLDLSAAGTDGDVFTFGAGFTNLTSITFEANDVALIDNIGWETFVAGPAAVPEPASAAFLGLGSLALVVRRLRRRTSVVA